MEKLICPACGSSNLSKQKYEDYVKENLGGQLLVDKILYHCNDCESEGDFFNDNERIVSDALVKLKSQMVVSILDDFTNNRVSLSSIERALDLPQRTLTKWKTGATLPSAAGVTLLKFIKLFPWLLEVAENKFEYEVSQKVYLSYAFNTIINKLSFGDSEFKEAGIITTAQSTFYYIHMQKKENESQVEFGNKLLDYAISVS